MFLCLCTSTAVRMSARKSHSVHVWICASMCGVHSCVDEFEFTIAYAQVSKSKPRVRECVSTPEHCVQTVSLSGLLESLSEHPFASLDFFFGFVHTQFLRLYASSYLHYRIPRT